MASKEKKTVTETGTRADLDTIVIPVVEEHLKLSKRQIVTGRVTLHKTVEEHLLS
jgi:uncharacterized protein (TIGR02271 family)